jgi:hypothetical protein
VKLQLHRNEWYVTHARRLLQERAAKGVLRGAPDELRALLKDHPEPGRRLRALWALHAVGALDAAARRELLGHADEDIRAWTVQLALESRDCDDETLALLARMAANDPSPVVRLYLAAGIRRLPAPRRLPVLEGLAGRAEDAGDANLPLLLWYAAEGLAEADRPAALALMKTAKIPLIREFMARRIAALATDRPILNVVTLGATGDGSTDDSAAFQKAIDQLAAGGGRVLVPWGVRPYRIAQSLRVTSDHVEFWGPGARLQFVDDATLTLEGAEGRALRDLALRGLRLEKAEGTNVALRIGHAEAVVLENLQVRGGASASGVDGLSILSSRFDVLKVAMAESGRPTATLRAVSVDRSFLLTGEASGVHLDACKLPPR